VRAPTAQAPAFRRVVRYSAGAQRAGGHRRHQGAREAGRFGKGSAAALAALGDQIEAASSAPGVEYSPAWAIKREALAARHAAFARARVARPEDSIFADYDRYAAPKLAGDQTLDRVDAASLLWRLELAGAVLIVPLLIEPSFDDVVALAV